MNVRRIKSVFPVLWVTIVLFVSGGATCSRRPVPAPYPPPPPINLGGQSSLDDVVAAINRTSAVRQLSTNTAKVEMLSMPSIPRLSATMHLQRDRDFRLRASLPIVLGAGLDMGSNQEMFWLEVPEGVRKTLYYARHDQYQQQLSRAILPVDPSFVMDSLGLVLVDRNQVVAGPVLRRDGKLELRTTRMTPSGLYQRVLYVEPQAGYVTDQLLYDPSGMLVAQSAATNHVYYEQAGIALPHQVRLNLKPVGEQELSMQIDVSSYTLNQLLTDDPQLFVIPTGSSKAVDLTQLGVAGPSASVSSASLSSASVSSGPIPMGTVPASPVPSGPAAYAADATLAFPVRGQTR